MSKKVPVICCIINNIFVLFLIVLGAICTSNFRNFNAYERSGTAHLTGLYTMGRDWQQRPFTDLMVTDETSCPDAWQATYERVFYGLDIGCDCFGVYSEWITD